MFHIFESLNYMQVPKNIFDFYTTISQFSLEYTTYINNCVNINYGMWLLIHALTETWTNT